VKSTGTLTEPSYIELKTIYWLRVFSAPLVCRGSFWTFEREPRFAVAKETIGSLAGRCWIEPTHREEDAFRDDWKLTKDGEAASHEFRGLLQQIVDRHIDWKIGKSQAKSSKIMVADYAAGIRAIEVLLAASKGIWLRDIRDVIAEDLLQNPL
jgi:hypothetical protein